MTKSTSFLLFGVVLLLVTALPGTRFVSTASAQQAAAGGGLEEVVVTARRREEALQDIPLAITAFTADDFEKRAILDMRDISRLTPGFAFEEFSGSGNTAPVIRGATQIAGSVEQPVSFFLDGVYLPRSYITDIGFTGIERIEVVKGPQSARYGRNAFMGAVNYVSKQPGDAWEIGVEGTYGDYDRFDLGGTVSGPVIEDKLGIVASFDYSEFDGSWKNPHPFCDVGFEPSTDCRVGGWDRTTFNIGVVATPTENLTIEVSYFDLDREKEQLAVSTFGELGHDSGIMNCGQYNPDVRPPGSGLGGGGDWYRLYCGELPFTPMAVDPRGYGGQIEADVLRIGVNYQFTDTLSFNYTYGTVEASLETMRYSDFELGCVYFLPGRCTFSGIGVSSNDTDSHDARLTYDSGERISFSVGYLYSPFRDLTQNAFGTAPPLQAAPTTPLFPTSGDGFDGLFVVLGQTLTENKITSPFAELTVSFMENRLRLGIEGRYTREERYQQALSSGGAGGVLEFAGEAFNATYTYFTPRITVDYDLNDSSMIYASAARGVKSGGFNTTAFLPENQAYQEDSNWTYEFGAKNTFGNFTLNANVFFIQWTNQQIPAADPQNPAVLPIVITLNLGDSTSKGFEMDGAWALNENLTLNGALYYGDATYDNGTFHLNFARTPAICDDVVCPTDGEISGNETPRAPRFMGTVGAIWEDSFGGSNLDYYLRGDLSYQSKSYADEMNLAFVPSRTVANATLGLSGDSYEFRLWIRNLFDEEYAAVSSIQQPNVKYDSTLGERRTFGLTATWKY